MLYLMAGFILMAQTRVDSKGWNVGRWMMRMEVVGRIGQLDSGISIQYVELAWLMLQASLMAEFG